MTQLNTTHILINVIKNGYYSTEYPTICHIKDIREFESKLISPKVFPDKSKVPLWNFAQHDNIPFNPNMTNRENFNQGLTKQKYFLLDFDSKEKVFNIDKVKDHFSKYNYWFYTSYNNTPEIPKFRIILEMADWYTNEEMKLIKTYYRDHYQRFFLLDDRTTFEMKRWFCVPALNPEKAQYYSYYINRGNPYPNDELEFYIRICRKQQEEIIEKNKRIEKAMLERRNNSDYDDSKEKQNAANYAHRELESMSDGNKHDTRLRINGFLHKTKIFTDDEIFEIMSQHCGSSEVLEKTRNLVYNYRK